MDDVWLETDQGMVRLADVMAVHIYQAPAGWKINYITRHEQASLVHISSMTFGTAAEARAWWKKIISGMIKL